MKNKLFGFFALCFLAFAPIASAQTYYSNNNAACVSIPANLSYGARSADVRALQTFLVNRNYPGSGSWMVSGTFGRATEAAVRNFQTEMHLPTSGWVDGATRDAISRVSCGTSASTYNPTNNYTYWNGYNNTVPYTNNPYTNNNPFNYYDYGNTYPYGYSYSAITLSSLSTTSGTPGTSLILYGSGFSIGNNTVYFNGITATGYSSNGASLSVIVPQLQPGAYSVSVRTVSGASSSISFTVVAASYTYYPNNGCTNYSCLSNPQIYSLSPNFGGVSAAITVYGNGFSATGNTVHFGNGIITNLISPDGQSVSFTVPSTITGYGSQQLTLGSYPVSVTNAQGAQTNTIPFTVTSVLSGNAPIISNLSGPNTLNTGTVGTWTLTLDNGSGTYTSASVNWGETQYLAYLTGPQRVYGSGQQIVQFTHAYSQAGTYTITFTVTNDSGYTNTSTATIQVYGGNGANNISIFSITPTYGHAGTQILIQGSGFTSDNTIHFGVGGVMHLAAINSSTLYYTIPSTVSACDFIGSACGAPTNLVTTGSYPLYITNNSGTSNTVTFNVQ